MGRKKKIRPTQGIFPDFLPSELDSIGKLRKKYANQITDHVELLLEGDIEKVKEAEKSFSYWNILAGRKTAFKLLVESGDSSAYDFSEKFSMYQKGCK